METKLRLGMALWVAACTCGSSAFPAEPQASPPVAERCGPPHYCARTDRQTVPYPPKPPALGPASSIVVDPDFHSRILRVTDASSDPQQPGNSFHTPGSSEQNSWNTTSTKLWLGATGGRVLLWDFDPANMTAHEVGNLKLPWSGEQFSYSQAGIMYGITDRHPVFQQYDLKSGKVSTIHEPTSCVPLNSSDSGTDISVSADDSRMSGVIGPEQDKNYLVYVYDRKQGCRWYNTETGEIGGKWGPTGTVLIPDRFGVHDARISKSGSFLEIAGAGNPLYWQLDTLNVAVCGKGYHCTGHHAMGYSHFINPSGWSDPMDLLIRPIDDLKAMIHLMPDLPAYVVWFDKHISWNYINPQDTTPACFSTYRSDNPQTPGAPLKVSRAWENEIDCVETDLKASTIWRFAHTYSSATNGFWSSPRGNVSQDGRFYMFTSDWENELGKDPKGGYRTDVFVVELR